MILRQAFDPDKDYCTLAPDGLFGVDWSFCCFVHDMDYTLGGSKLAADTDLWLCMADTHPAIGPLAASVFFVFLLLFGSIWWRKARGKAQMS